MKGLSPSSQDPSVSGSLSFLVGKGAGSLALVLRRLQFSRHEHTQGLSQELTRSSLPLRHGFIGSVPRVPSQWVQVCTLSPIPNKLCPADSASPRLR